MEIKLNSIDVVQITKALKSGWLDLDKIDSFKSLVNGYNPPKQIKEAELSYYLDCLYKGWGYVPTAKESIKEAMQKGFNGELLQKWEESIDDGSVYNQLVKYAFIGLLAIKGMGGTFYDIEPDFSFTEKKPPTF